MSTKLVAGLVLGAVALVCVGGILASLVSELAVRLCRCMFTNFSFSKRQVRALYCLLVVANVFVVLLVERCAIDWKVFSSWQPPAIAGCEDSALCIRQQLAFRMSACLTLFFGCLLGLMFCGKELAQAAHSNLMLLKVAAVPVMFLISLFFSNRHFDTFGSVTVYLSFAYLILQIVALIDFAYNWNESWVANAEDTDNTWWLVAIVGVSGVITVATLAVAIGIACESLSSLCMWLTILVLLVSLVLTGISITDWIPHGALLVSTVVMAFAVFQLWAGFQSYGPYNPRPNSLATRGFLSYVMAFCTLIYNSITLSSQPDVYHCTASASKGNAAGTVREILTDSMQDDGLVTGGGTARHSAHVELAACSSSSVFAHVNQLQWFHGVLFAFAPYFCMLCTNWLSVEEEEGNNNGALLLTSPIWSFSVLTTSAFGTLVLYLWTLIAPKLFPERSF